MRGFIILTVLEEGGPHAGQGSRGRSTQGADSTSRSGAENERAPRVRYGPHPSERCEGILLVCLNVTWSQSREGNKGQAFSHCIWLPGRCLWSVLGGIEGSGK